MPRSHKMGPSRRLLLATVLGLLPLEAMGVQQYCSPANTGSNFLAGTFIYNSNGRCSDACRSNYAFAIVQYQNCWCSNLAPGRTEDVGDCNQNCPGFPSEKCGNEQEGLFGYIALDKAPSGTQGGAVPTTRPNQPSTSTSNSGPSIADTVYLTVNQPGSTIVVVSTVNPTTQNSPPTTSSVPTTTTPPPQPTTSILTTVVSGIIVTKTVTVTPTGISSDRSSEGITAGPVGLTGGAIAGIVIGVLAGLALLILLAFFCWRRRRQSGDDGAAAAATASPSSKSRLGRNVSVLSKAGLINRGARPSMSEINSDDHHIGSGPSGIFVTPANGTHSVRHSMLFAGGAHGEGGVQPESPLDSSDGRSGHGHTASSAAGGIATSSSSRRNSRPLVYDQRLNPSALFANHDNGSRISMQDQQDYSRPLGVMNPDPRASFDSRRSRIE